MRVGKVMSSPVVATTPSASISEAAAQMRRHDVGALVVVAQGELPGIVTDRDIVRRLLARSALDAPVAAAMTHRAVTCSEDQDVAEAAALMGDAQIRRLPVVDRSGRVVGMLSLGDIAENVSEGLAGQALGEICETR